MTRAQSQWIPGWLRRGDRRFVAVDFDSRQLRLVYAERGGGGLQIIKLLGRPMPEGLDIAEPKPVGEFLRATLREQGLAGLPVVMCVPRGLAVLKTLSFPPGTAESELASMVQYQVEKELPFRMEEAVVDFTPQSHFDPEADAEGSPAGQTVLVAAVRLPAVDYYRQIALAARVGLRRLGLRPYAVHRCLEACLAGRQAEPCAIVHLTADETEIDVVAGGSLAFSRSATAKLPAPSCVRPEEWEEAVQSVVTETIRSLQSYQAVEGGRRVERVYVAGATGLEARVAEQLAARLALPCEMFRPAQALRLGAADGGASEFVAALGLAIAHGGRGTLPFDFLNPKRPPVQRDKRRARALSAAAAVCGVVLAGVLLGGQHLRAKEQALAEDRNDYNKLLADKKRVDRLAERVRAIEQWERQSPHWLDHYAQLSALLPACTEVYVPGLTGGSDGSLSFTIRATSEQAVTEIIGRLREAGYEADARQQRKTNDARYMHTAEMRVKPPEGMLVSLADLDAEPRPEDDATPEQLAQRRTFGQPERNRPGEPDRPRPTGSEGPRSGEFGRLRPGPTGQQPAGQPAQARFIEPDRPGAGDPNRARPGGTMRRDWRR